MKQRAYLIQRAAEEACEGADGGGREGGRGTEEERARERERGGTANAQTDLPFVPGYSHCAALGQLWLAHVSQELSKRSPRYPTEEDYYRTITLQASPY